MLGTIISIILGAFLFFFLPSESINPALLTIIITVIPILFMLLYGISFALALNPMQRVEQNLTPRLLQLFRKDLSLKSAGAWMVFFVITSTAFACSGFSFLGLGVKGLMLTWILLFGITFDIYLHFNKRLFDYLNPFTIVEMFTSSAKESIKDEHEMDLCDWIDALSEVAVKSLHRSSTSLCNNTIDELSVIAKNFFMSETSISHHADDSEAKAHGIEDKISFTLFFLLQRIEMIFHHSMEKKIEPVCSHLATGLGKIAIASAKCDITLVIFPIELLGKLTLNAQKHHMTDVGLKAIFTLIEVAREIIEEIDITYLDLKHPFMTLNTQIEEITKEMFRQDKSIDLKILFQPFIQMKELLQSPKILNHQDQSLIVKDIDRILDEFAHLQTVMKTAPPQEKTEAVKA